MSRIISIPATPCTTRRAGCVSVRPRSATARLKRRLLPVPSFDSRLENAVSDALRHPLDPEIMHEPELESKKALWSVAARFGAAIGVSALVALFFVVVVPGSRQATEGEPSTTASIAQSIKNVLFQSGRTRSKPALSEFQAVLASTPAQPLRHRPSRRDNCSSSSCNGARSQIQATPQRATP